MAALRQRDFNPAPPPGAFGTGGTLQFGSRPARILLIVGDHSVWTLQRRLEASGAEVRVLTSPEESVRGAREYGPDVIVLDIAGPEDLQTLRALKKDSQTHLVPVLALTGVDDADARVQSLEEGAVDCLSRPFTLSELTARLRVVLRVRGREDALRRRVSFLETLAASDPLTSLLNRRAFIDRLHLEMERAARTEEPLSCLIIDIDWFKAINDRYGHHVGDDVLRQIAKVLVEGHSEADAVCRYGGEEFVWLMPGVDRDTVLERAEWLRRTIAETEIPTTEGAFQLSVSIGASTYRLTEHGRLSAHLLLAQADAALLEAKKLGKNRVVFREPVSLEAGEDPPAPARDAVEDPREAWGGGPGTPDSRGSSARAAAAESWDAWGRNAGAQEELRRLLLSSVRVLIGALEAKDPETMSHCQRVANVAEAIAMELDVPAHEVERIRLASLLHDLGKLAIPERVLQKPGPLSAEEWDLIRKHPERGARILQGAEPYSHLVDLVLYHQESFDGTGYPDGLAGPDIPLGARIIRVADTFDAMTSDRAYRPRKSLGQAQEELRAMAGTILDPDAVAALLRLLETMTPLEIELLMRRGTAEVGDADGDEGRASRASTTLLPGPPVYPASSAVVEPARSTRAPSAASLRSSAS